MNTSFPKSNDPFRDGLLLFTRLAVFKPEEYPAIPFKAWQTAVRNSFIIWLSNDGDKLCISYQHNQVSVGKQVSAPVQSGYICVFKQNFLPVIMKKNISQLEVFRKKEPCIIDITAGQFREALQIFVQMHQETKSSYAYKYHLIRNQIAQLIHLGIKASQPPSV
ncbi:hypothetical protein HNQ91_002280 [Filimonas zeae]|uniref:Uncharacterized protein n=1 Tax=Filimonas zeae TaxID=1737353 RepID=A0A917MWA1_9BACT|nr:hypothetical protein [Filimonas zeae]MDR6339229.1 hypothetical protein [Filimonas zeae]GGH64523.1 hypothetical protein GCM10011379_16660 [Filimonas zeae]